MSWYAWSHNQPSESGNSQYPRVYSEEKMPTSASSSSTTSDSNSTSNSNTLDALIAKAKNFLIGQNINPQKVVDYQEKTWPDACLGMYGEGDKSGEGNCTLGTVHGYEIWFADSPGYYINVNISNDGKIMGTGGNVPVEYFDTTGAHLRLRQ